MALLFDPNDYKPQIMALVKEHTGRELTIPGEISVSVFPWLAQEKLDEKKQDLQQKLQDKLKNPFQ